MKTTSLLLPLLLTTALTASAQQDKDSNATGALVPADEVQTKKAADFVIKEVSIPAGAVLEQVKFDQVELSEAIRYLETQENGLGGRSLNVVLAPGLERRVVPSLTLRNVTTTEVLSVITTLLGLAIEPVKGDDGAKVAAWLVQEKSAHSPSLPQSGSERGGGGLSPAFRDAAAETASLAARTSPAGEGSGGGSPEPVVPGGGAGGAGFSYERNAPSVPMEPHFAPVPAGGVVGNVVVSSTPSPQLQSRVFSLAALLPRMGHGPEAEKRRQIAQEVLLEQLQRFANDQDSSAQVKHYGELDLLVVKSSPAAMALISEAIEQMRKDARYSQFTQPPAPANVPVPSASDLPNLPSLKRAENAADY